MKPSILRLLVTDRCERNCPGCCNNDWNLGNLDVEDDFRGYRMICLTGGEPMLEVGLVYDTIQRIRSQNACPLIMYTADVRRRELLLWLLKHLDGLTVTLHDKADIPAFTLFHEHYKKEKPDLGPKLMQLNIFREVNYNPTRVPWGDTDMFWVVKNNIAWIKNCPLPPGEVFKRL